MSRIIVFATGNKGKMKEIRMILEDTDYEIYSMAEAGIEVEIVEDGSSYAENALIKARTVAAALTDLKKSGKGIFKAEDMVFVLADDSGFEVDYLDRAPGIYSARYMGEDTPYSIKNRSLIDKLKGVPDEQRTARFMCSIACICPNGREEVFTASYEGMLAHEAKGTNGFGYDPVFFVPEYGKTDAELPLEVKNKIGHRGKALRMAKEFLTKEA